MPTLKTPTLNIQGTELQYDEKDIITFSEGLIGLPHLRRMVIVRQTAIEPLLWLASIDEEGVALVVADTRGIFPAYSPAVPGDSSFHAQLEKGDNPLTFAIMLIVPEWQKSTANLRAPIFVSMKTMTGAQVILADNAYSVGEKLPLAMAA
jgi:flagellar assembly factor FliW